MNENSLFKKFATRVAQLFWLNDGAGTDEKTKKIRVFKYKSKDRSNRKTQGHRQPYTKIKITKING